MNKQQTWRWGSLVAVAAVSAVSATAIHSWAEPAPARPPAAAPSASAPRAQVPQVPAPQAPSVKVPPGLAGFSGSIADVAERVVPSVVNLSVTRARKEGPGQVDMRDLDPMLRQFFFGPGGHGRGPGMPGSPRSPEHSLGSGVIVGADGLVLTSAHVVERADRVEVTLHDGREVDATVIGTDPRSDLAALRIDRKDATGLVALPMGDSTKLRLGEVVLAVGNPFGVGQTVTMGIVSGTRRSALGIVDYEDFIQTDAAINPGNSGGALVDMRGQLVGINTAILSRSGGNQGVGFAIPTSMIQPILKSLVATGKVTRGWLGVAIQELDRDLAQALGLKAGEGVLVADVEADTPAARAGLERGDVVRAIDGEKMTSSAALRNKVASIAPGTTARLEVLRDGKVRTVDVTLGTLPEDDKVADARARDGQRDSGDRGAVESEGDLLGGARLGALSPAMRRRLEVPSSVKGGVVIERVAPGSGAARLGLRPGDVVVEVDRKPVRSPGELRERSRAAKDDVVVVVIREGRSLYLAGRK